MHVSARDVGYGHDCEGGSASEEGGNEVHAGITQ